MVTRAKLAEFCGAPWFGEWVTGAFLCFWAELRGADPRSECRRLGAVLDWRGHRDSSAGVQALPGHWCVPSCISRGAQSDPIPPSLQGGAHTSVPIRECQHRHPARARALQVGPLLYDGRSLEQPFQLGALPSPPRDASHAEQTRDSASSDVLRKRSRLRETLYLCRRTSTRFATSSPSTPTSSSPKCVLPSFLAPC